MLSIGVNIVSQLLGILADIGLRVIVGLVAKAIYSRITIDNATGGNATDRVGGQPGPLCPNAPGGCHHSPGQRYDSPALYWRQEMRTEVFNNRYNTQADSAPAVPNIVSMGVGPPPVYPGFVQEE